MADEFTRAERDDWLLEKAQDEVDRQIDWDLLHDWDDRVEAYEADRRADLKTQAERSERMLPRLCPICHGRWIVVVAGPDENGQFDTTDCPCQR